MCKNDKNHKHCHSRNLDFGINKNIEHSVVENGAKEHLKEYERNVKKKFDYKKYVKKPNRAGNGKVYGFDDVKFEKNVYGDEKIGVLELPNGFVLEIHIDEYEHLRFITIRDGLTDYMHDREIRDYIPSLHVLFDNLRKKAELMYICDVIRLAQNLTEEDWKEFRDRS